MAKAAKSKYLLYKGKPLVRRGGILYYGNPEAPYIIRLTITSTETAFDMEIANAVTVDLITNTGKSKEKVIKTAQREGLYKAMDIGEFWLEDALENV